MKRTITNSLILLFAIGISLGFSSLDEKGKVHLKVTKEENGEKSIFEKIYMNMDELKADERLKQFDVLVENWTKEHSKGIIIKKRIDTNPGYTRVSDDDLTHIVIQHKDDNEKTIEIKEEKVIIIKSDEDGKLKVIVIEEDGDATAEIEVEVKKEIGKYGGGKIIEKKVWITKDGKKIELDKENDYEFETDGDKITIKVDEKTMEITDFSGEKTEGDHVMVFRGKEDDNENIKQTISVNVEEKNGEQFIEIDIKRTNKLNMTISEILKDDTSLDGIDYSLKNNLNPSQLNYYPNPNDGRFNLKFMLDQKEEVTVKVINILGNEVYKEKLLDFNGAYDNVIDLTGKEKGIYILQIIQKRKALTRKILIE